MSARLGAVGTLIRDRIWHPSTAAPVDQLGGAAYSLAALSAARPAGWSVAPIIKVGADVWDQASGWLSSLPGVVPDGGVRMVLEPNNHVELRYHDAANRCETLTGGVPPWTGPEISAAAAGARALYVNFISGMEMDLDAARALRASFPGPIYADLHSLFLGPPGPGPRRPRALPRADEWLACFDAVQMNEAELALLGLLPGELEALLRAGPSLALVTRGGAGATFATRVASGPSPISDLLADPAARGPLQSAPVTTGEIPTEAGELDGDPTGCGDVWGATCCAVLLAGATVHDAVTRAHAAAAARIRHPDIPTLHVALASSNTPARVLP